jgi:dTDP-4-dehydrorhamnose 3,5-epimerase
VQVYKTKLPGLLIIEPKVYKDSRGFFFETFYESKYKAGGINKPFVQDNISRSTRNVLRGLHYQLERPQAKLVSVFRGAVFDVAVDIRKGSPTFGQWEGLELSDKNNLQLFIPEGFAHGFCVLSDEADFFYKCTDYYHPESEHGILWNDPDLAISWKIADPILSEKDKKYKRLKDVLPEVLPN